MRGMQHSCTVACGSSIALCTVVRLMAGDVTAGFVAFTRVLSLRQKEQGPLALCDVADMQ